MRAVILGLAACMAAAASANAQSDALPGAEIGIRSGWSRISNGGNATNTLALPGSGFFGVGAVHATVFASQRIAVEPQFGIVRVTEGGNAETATIFGAQLMYFFEDPAHAPYAFAQGTLHHLGSGDNGMTAFTTGGGLGYRWVAYKSLALRVEGLYRRWSHDAEGDEFAVLVGFGAVLAK